jgi:hypothetical protein
MESVANNVGRAYIIISAIRMKVPPESTEARQNLRGTHSKT